MCTYFFCKRLSKNVNTTWICKMQIKKRCAASTCLVKICCKWFIFAIRRLSLPPPPKSDVTFFSCIQSLYFFIFQTRIVTTFFILFMQATENMKKSPIYFLLLKQKSYCGLFRGHEEVWKQANFHALDFFFWY